MSEPNPTAHDVISSPPDKVETVRELHCQNYERCLNTAILEDWKSFGCGSCPLAPLRLRLVAPQMAAEPRRGCRRVRRGRRRTPRTVVDRHARSLGTAQVGARALGGGVGAEVPGTRRAAGHSGMC